MTSTAYPKFLPPDDLPEFHAPFWESVRAHRVALQRCDDCGRYRYIPMEICPRCGSGACTWTPISGRGEVYTYTVVHRAPTPAYQEDVPYVIAHVTMSEGPRMISNLVGVEPADVRIGMPVRLSYLDIDDATSLFAFVPDDTDDTGNAA
jgi:uncharacterized OB-fold protein